MGFLHVKVLQPHSNQRSFCREIREYLKEQSWLYLAGLFNEANVTPVNLTICVPEHTRFLSIYPSKLLCLCSDMA